MHRARLLIVTAVIAAGAGLVLLFFPAVAFLLLFRVDRPTPESAFVAPVAGALLLFFGVACCSARKRLRSREATAVIAVMLLYNILIAAILAYAEGALKMVGIVLWPAVGLHTMLAVWCLACLLVRPGNNCGEVHGDRSKKYPEYQS
jgi:Kef-type K+ transport system membrane component KefB